MRKTFATTGQRISKVIDFFYPPFRKYLALEFFRYAFIGAVNVGFSLVLYFVVYNFMLHQQMVWLGSFPLSSHAAALFISFPFSNFFGFLLQKYVTFTESDLRGKVQLYRYFIVVLLNLGINYVVLTLLVKGFHFWAVPSQMGATFFCVLVSYFSQKKYTFKSPAKLPADDSDQSVAS